MVGLRVTFLLILVCLPAAAQPGFRMLQQIVPRKQVALVVGNGAYTRFGQLKNPANDADAMARRLQQLNYDVLLVKNAGRRMLGQKIDEFIGRLGTGDVAFFYYAGHGVQVEGENYLIPVDFDGETEIDVRYDAHPIGKVQERMERSGAQLNILVLDACRNNPFRFAGRAGTRGWAAMNAGRGTFIAFATAPGSVASDNVAADNGLFTQELLEALTAPGLGLDEVFNYVRARVDQVSGGKQLPWAHSSVVGRYHFVPGTEGHPPSAPSPAVTRPPAATVTESGVRQEPTSIEATETIFGASILPVSSAEREEMKLEAGMGMTVTRVLKDSFATEIGLQAGDVMLSIN